MLFGTASYAQSWRLINPDSMVLLPLKDLKHIAALRSIEGENARYLVQKSASFSTEIYHLREAIAKQKKALELGEKLAADYRVALEDCNAQTQKLREKTLKLRPWATIGKVVVIGGSVATMLVLATNLATK